MFFNLFKTTNSVAQWEEYRADPTAVVVDVREKNEYQSGHLPGAINLPLRTLPKTVDKKLRKKDQKIALYCRSGARASRAKAYLTQLGYTNVVNLGGMRPFASRLVK